jgi:flavin-dependent dehydrogenase
VPALLDLFPRIQERLHGAPFCDAPRAVGPMQRLSNAPAATGVVLVGDASGYVDAITGEGISLALAEALALEQTVVPLLKSPRAARSLLTMRDLDGYIQAHRAVTRPYRQMTHLLLFLSRHPVLGEAAIRVLSGRPALFQHLLSANMGLAPLWPGVRRLFSSLLGKRLVTSP